MMIDNDWQNSQFLQSSTNVSGTHVSSIVIKTGTVQHAESNCTTVLKICDHYGNCCRTSPNLDNPGVDRAKGQIDRYTNKTLLGSCAQKVINMILVQGGIHKSIFYNFRETWLESQTLRHWHLSEIMVVSLQMSVNYFLPYYNNEYHSKWHLINSYAIRIIVSFQMALDYFLHN